MGFEWSWVACPRALLLLGPWQAGGRLPSSLFPADSSVPRVGLGGIWCGIALTLCGTRGCGHVCDGAVGVCVCERPEGVRGKASKAWPQRERDVAGSPRMARPWRGHSEAGGTAGSRGTGAHARAWVLASQGRGVAVPSAGHRHLGPTAQRDGGRRRQLRLARRRDGLLHKSGTKAGRVR
jgi:hypothetical protein